jgi:glycosyltransferase involved in cell wall biosynthesis
LISVRNGPGTTPVGREIVPLVELPGGSWSRTMRSSSDDRYQNRIAACCRANEPRACCDGVVNPARAGGGEKPRSARTSARDADRGLWQDLLRSARRDLQGTDVNRDYRVPYRITAPADPDLMSVNENTKPIRVFVHLAANFDARRWEQRWQSGRIIGINERMPYGYFRASEDGCVIVYSENKPSNLYEKLVRSWIMRVGKIDFFHAWQNRKEIFDCDVVWTHTEIQYLAILLLFRILFWKRRPKLIAQSIWLFDRWHGLGPLKRWILSRLISKVDVLTVHSPENLKVARVVFPKIRSELVLFGINTDEFGNLKKEMIHRPVRILSIGNDPHRDWPVLIRAVKDMPDCHLKIVSKNVSKAKLNSYSNIEALHLSSNNQLFDAFDWADFVVVPLKANLHASGTTVLQEAAIRGVAAICTDTGGLRAYFSDEEVYFVPVGDSSGIQKAIMKLSSDDELRWGLAARAQTKMKTGGISSRCYARRHAELSREALSRESGSWAAANVG